MLTSDVSRSGKRWLAAAGISAVALPAAIALPSIASAAPVGDVGAAPAQQIWQYTGAPQQVPAGPGSGTAPIAKGGDGGGTTDSDYPRDGGGGGAVVSGCIKLPLLERLTIAVGNRGYMQGAGGALNRTVVLGRHELHRRIRHTPPAAIAAPTGSLAAAAAARRPSNSTARTYSSPAVEGARAAGSPTWRLEAAAGRAGRSPRTVPAPVTVATPRVDSAARCPIPTVKRARSPTRGSRRTVGVVPAAVASTAVPPARAAPRIPPPASAALERVGARVPRCSTHS